MDRRSFTYEELLQSEKWKQKRRQILERDGWRCRECGYVPTYDHIDFSIQVSYVPDPHNSFATETGPGVLFANPAPLHVHHHYYVLGKAPWEYADDALITLCPDCHVSVHKKGTTPVYSHEHRRVVYLSACIRCGGRGHLPQYRHVQGGICFRCRGAALEGISDQLISAAIPSGVLSDGEALVHSAQQHSTNPASGPKTCWSRGLFVDEVSTPRLLQLENGEQREYWRLALLRRYMLNTYWACRYFWLDDPRAPDISSMRDLMARETDLLPYEMFRIVDVGIKSRPFLLEGHSEPVTRRDGSVVLQHSAALIVLEGESEESALKATFRGVQMRSSSS